MARDYVEGHRVDKVSPVRFLLLALALQWLVVEIVARYYGQRIPPQSQWLSLMVLAYSVPMAYLLRILCADRRTDLAEVMAWVCYAMSALVLAMIPFAIAKHMHWQTALTWTLTGFPVLLLAYWAYSLRRFFRCSWWRALAAANLVGLLGVVSFNLLLQLID